MRYRLIALCVLSIAWRAVGQQPQPEPDAGNVSDNTFESSFFKFRYSIPQGWSAVPDDVRMAENRKKHERNLLIAAPKLLAPGEKAGLSRIKVYALERSSDVMFGSTTQDKAGDLGRIRAKFNPGGYSKSRQVTISGQKFVRSDFEYPPNTYRDKSFQALFETVSGNYLIVFEFTAKSGGEIKSLAKTMETLQFAPTN